MFFMNRVHEITGMFNLDCLNHCLENKNTDYILCNWVLILAGKMTQNSQG